MSVKKSIYEDIRIESVEGGKTVDIRLGVASIDYYEDIFSPTITAKIVVGNVGYQEGGKLIDLYDGLPIRGREKLYMKIAGNSSSNPGLNFIGKNCLYVSGVSNVIKQTQSESFVLNLVSREAITNETTRVPKKFKKEFTIDNSVRKILEEYIKTNKIEIIDKTSNRYGFYGNLRNPFTLIIWLATKSVPEKRDGTAGFVFYQTQDGFYFRSIDKMIDEEPKATYTYTDVNKSSIERNNDFTILSYTIQKNQNLIEKLRLGTYSSSRLIYDPYTFNITLPEKAIFKAEENVKSTKNLGKPIKLPDLSEISNRISPGMGDRLFPSILDVGTSDPEVSKEENALAIEYQAQSMLRYNTLFLQTISMIVPSNTNLRAGDIIKCEFPKISTEKNPGFDTEQSGLYMIKELCHHFDTDGSYTSMLLVRDTFGQKTRK